ncbi:hypothetical protein [Arthrobacter bambusae]|uniref:hypothetical protein n=1 Tax=Arthrobacter bambusae TaxID=1338426 RepID=UPI002789795F|nr:hypothetical protein [Arthrobacter bambusae]MDQ0241498.1 hypothetical protein [Arthrobacter bambusae]
MTAAEVIAEKERLLREDPEYRAKFERMEADRAQRVAELRAAAQPVVRDLAAIGIKVGTLWDLYKIPDSRPAAFPVLLAHITRDYPDGVLESIGQGFCHKSARAWWPELKRIYLETQIPVVRNVLAAALSECAAKDQYEDLLSFVNTTRLGSTRIYFLRPLNRIGNRMQAGKGRAVVQSFSEDPVLGKEATAILKGRSRNE